MSYQITRQKYLTDQEIFRFNVTLQELFTTNPQAAVAFWMLLQTGGRVNEVLQLKWSDVNHETKSVYLKGLKGSEDREIPISDATYLRLMTLDKLNKFVFQIVHWELRREWYKIRPAAKMLHSLRHTFAVLAYSRTKDLLLVQAALGHRNVKNTIVYATLLDKQEKLKSLCKIF